MFGGLVAFNHGTVVPITVLKRKRSYDAYEEKKHQPHILDGVKVKLKTACYFLQNAATTKLFNIAIVFLIFPENGLYRYAHPPWSITSNCLQQSIFQAILV